MSYSIVESSVKDFIDNASNIKLPRFQRKQTWKDVDNFKLCISVFKDYPVGVVIVNRNKEADWLLDGRQRRNALKLMRENFVEVYNWAKSFVKFSPNDTEDQVRDKFWKKIDIYLQKEFEKKAKTGDNESGIEIEEDIDEEGVDSFDAETQYASLMTLLNIVLIVHGKRVKGRTHIEQMFLFDGIVDAEDLNYTVVKNGEYEVDPVKLRRKILDAIDDNAIDEDSFYPKLLQYRLDKETDANLKKYVHLHWEYFGRCIDVVKQSEAVITRAKIGMIRLQNASVLDAQNIFSLVNDGGTKLTAEELLSARPFWNVKVQNPSGEVKDEVEKLYKTLGIDRPDDVYRWDFGATLLSRIDEKHIIFEELPIEKETTLTRRMALGFKLLSAVYLGGITNNDVTALENPKKIKINWDVDIDRLVRDLNAVIKLIEDHDYFRYLSRWNQSVMSLTTNAAAQEFLTILYLRWKDLGKPTKANVGAGVTLCKEAVILFDRLIYEYCTKVWKGSSDSRLSGDIKNINDRLQPVKTQEWIDLLEELAGGTYKGAEVKVDGVKGLIYHYCVLKKLLPVPKDIDTVFEIDHIVAQNIFANSHAMVNTALKNSIANLSPLPKGKNIAKLDKPLNKIQDTWLIEEIRRYTGLLETDIDKYSDITNIEELCKQRMSYYREAFSSIRTSLLAN